MNLCEHAGKILLAEAGVGVPRGKLAATPSEASHHAVDLGPSVAVKAQVTAGGRGRAGGVELVRGRKATHAAAERILGMEIKGQRVSEVLVEETLAVTSELYVAMVLDREAKCMTAMLAARGGMAVEELLAADPGALARLEVPPLLGWCDFMARRLCVDAGLDAPLVSPLNVVLRALWHIVATRAATLVEVNPLGVLDEGRLVALDAKVTIDDSAVGLRPELARLSSCLHSAGDENTADAEGFGYVRLDGDIGILGNGAGLVMSTLDAVTNAGGHPADFLDIGGGATARRIAAAISVVAGDDRVSSVLINVFGGITRCDEVARGILEALAQSQVALPVVVRLDGTNASEGLALLREANAPNVHVVESMSEAAAQVLALRST